MIIRRLLTHLRDDRGISVIELVLASALSMVILLSLLAVADSATRAERGSQARQDALLDLRGAMTRASKDIRQATDVSSSSSSTTLDIQTLVLGIPTRMVFSVSGTEFRREICTNFDFAMTCGGTAAALASNVTAAQPFCYDPPDCLAAAPTPVLSLVRITIAGTPAVQSDKEITLATDVQLRNM